MAGTAVDPEEKLIAHEATLGPNARECEALPEPERPDRWRAHAPTNLFYVLENFTYVIVNK
jgi:hypothetical protein